MEQALVISNLVLWAALVGLALVVLALVRQLGVLHERLAPAGALSMPEGLRAGEAAPELALADLAGEVQRVGGSDPEGRDTLLFFLSPSCPVCKALLPAVRALARSERGQLRVLLASDGPRGEHEALVRERGLTELPYLLSAELGLAFRVARLPFAVLLDAAGVVRARGLVNSREHLESLLEARAHGVASLQEWVAASDGTRGAA